jgi:hypothetical protein
MDEYHEFGNILMSENMHFLARKPLKRIEVEFLIEIYPGLLCSA